MTTTLAAMMASEEAQHCLYSLLPGASTSFCRCLPIHQHMAALVCHQHPTMHSFLMLMKFVLGVQEDGRGGSRARWVCSRRRACGDLGRQWIAQEGDERSRTDMASSAASSRKSNSTKLLNQLRNADSLASQRETRMRRLGRRLVSWMTPSAGMARASAMAFWVADVAVAVSARMALLGICCRSSSPSRK